MYISRYLISQLFKIYQYNIIRDKIRYAYYYLQCKTFTYYIV